jgi:leucyl aminopeptidase (aminopeptidase T)
VANADVWIEFALAYIMHSEAFREAMRRGARYANLTGMDVQMLVDTIARVDFPGVMRLGQALVGLIGAADEVRITSPAGTDLVGRNQGRPVNLRGKPAERPGETVMLAGQISWNPVEATQNGQVVFDGAVWPPNELGLLNSPVACTVRDGVVTDIQGGPDAQTFKRWMHSHADPNMFRVAHWSLGFNPGVTRPTGRIVEDERVFGCVELGIGTKGAWIGGEPWVAAAHTDGSLLQPSIYLDGVPIEENGTYVHPELAAICRELQAPGY